MFRGLNSKFKRWQEAGLITADQTAKILAFEKTRKKGKLIKDLTKIGVFAILVGVLSIVAANWQEIPSIIKLIGHFILNAGLAVYMVRLDEVKKPIIKEACILGLFGFFLTFIALIGQVYQLHGDLHSTLLVWLLICTPFVWFYGRTYFVAGPWLLAALVTLYLNIDFYLEHMPAMMNLVGTLVTFYLPLLLLVFSKLPQLERFRPGFIWTFRKVGLFLPALLANIAILLFYTTREIEYYNIQLPTMAAGLLVIFVLFKPRDKNDQESVGLWYYLIVSGIVTMLPFAFPDLESGILSAVLFCMYWMFLAWLGANMHAESLTNWAIRLIILRIFIVYLEVFGSLLMTGFGLITSGIILLVILRYLGRIVAVGRKLVNYEITF